MRVIFLDFDGVLNSVRSAKAFGGYPWNVREESLKLFDPVALALIRNFCKKYDIKIILSSTWRNCFPFSLLAEKLDLPIIGQTPKLFKSRGYEIQRWLEAHSDIKEFAIIDDDGDMLESQKSRFIHCNFNEGFSWSNYIKLHNILGEEIK